MNDQAIGSPNVTDAVTAKEPQVTKASLEKQIGEMLAARPGRNRPADAVSEPVAGLNQAATPEAAPVAPATPEGTTNETVAPAPVEVPATESGDAVSSEQAEAVINFLDFAKDNPDAKFRFPNKNAEGGFVELTAEKAAAILGQGSAIHEEQRQFKAREAEFNEYEAKRKQELDSLSIAMEFTVAPQLKTAYDEIVKTQGYNQQFTQMMANETDVAEQLKIKANIEQNERYIREQAEFIKTNKPKLDQFQQHRSQQVKTVLDQTRGQFSDKELKNEFYYNELREKIARDWKSANDSFIPGVKNLDLVSSDEHILGLLRDGLKYREGPKVVSSGSGSLAAATATQRKSASVVKGPNTELQERAAKGDKNASRDLLSAYLTQQRGTRKAS